MDNLDLNVKVDNMDSVLKRIELRHFRLVKAITEEGGLSAAAKHLHLTQSALSHQLKVLEETLGEILFHRHGKKLVITETGCCVLEYSLKIFDELNAMQLDIVKIRQGQKATLRIATECYTSFHWLPKIIPESKKRFPEVNVELQPQASNQLTALLESGDINVAIRMAPTKARFQNHILFKDELLVVISKDHELASLQFVTPQQLISHHLLLCPNAKEKLLLGLAAYVDIKSLNTTELPLTEGIIQWCSAGLGVAIMADWAVKPWLDQENITVRPLNVNWSMRSWSAVTLPQELPVYMKEFIQLLREQALLF
jgi:LysR family transcriptional regulator for metE and metH